MSLFATVFVDGVNPSAERSDERQIYRQISPIKSI